MPLLANCQLKTEVGRLQTKLVVILVLLYSFKWIYKDKAHSWFKKLQKSEISGAKFYFIKVL